MERLTYWCDNGHGGGKWFVAIDAEGGEDYGPHVDRLAAYEETGLEPEEVKYAYQKGWKGALDEIAYEEQAGTILVDNPLLAKYIELGPVDRLRELAQADSMSSKILFPTFNVSLGQAINIVKTGLADESISLKTRVLAIDHVAHMETHNSITKDELVEALRWLFDHYDFEED